MTISNTADGKKRIEALYGENYLIVPYVMPGFVLAKVIEEMTRGVDWESLEGMILHNHGVFTFDQDAKRSYNKMIETVAKAEAYLQTHAPLDIETVAQEKQVDIETLRDLLSQAKGYEVVLLSTAELK